MKKRVFFIMSILTLSLVSCRGYEREQNRLDRESEGKGELLKAESTKKVKIEQAKADLESAKLDAQTKLERARANAEAKLINAKASAEASLIIAKSESEANRILTESLNPTILEYNKINRWNGKLPTTSVGGGSSSIISIK
jgi:regulator of protease activity HflC (stomatin/prohibitin superfamily)